MDPLNKIERKLAIWHFLLIYGASLVIPFAAAAFLFRTPTKALERENENLRFALEEQVRLNERLETMVTGLRRLGESDKAYISTTNDLEQGNLKRKINEHEGMIQSALYDLKHDTAEFKIVPTRQFSGKVITVVDAALSYRHTIAYLRDMLEKNGVNTQVVDKLNTELAAKNEKINMLQLLLARGATPPAEVSKTSEGPKAPDCSGFQAKLQKAEQEIARLRAASPPSPAPISGPISEGVIREQATRDFVELLIRKGDDAKKTPCARKPMYELAIETLGQYGKPESKSTIADLHQKIRKISD
jgi:hypothetical protein